jgi:hypothetical protein
MFNRRSSQSNRNSPFIQLCNFLNAVLLGIHEANQVLEDRLPDSKLKFVHKVDHEHFMQFEVGTDAFDESVLSVR